MAETLDDKVLSESLDDKVLSESLDDKVLWVQRWLSDVSPDLASAKYEINEYTVNYLYQLSLINAKKSAHNTLICQDNLAKAEEYSIEADRLEQHLAHLGVTADGLSEVSRSTLSDLAETACHLQLSQPSNENYMLALSDLTMQEITLTELVERKEEKVQDIKEKLDNIKLQIDKMSEKEKEKDNKENEKDDDNKFNLVLETEVAKSQAHRYQEQKVKYKEILRNSGIRREYTHKQLEKEAGVMTQLEQEVSVLKERLAVFKKLPPSISLAEEEIRQVEVEIQSVDLEISKKNM